MQSIGNKIINLHTNNPAPDHFVEVFNIPFISDWLDSVFSNYDKIRISTAFSALFLRSSLTTYTKILFPRISFRVKTTDIENHFDIYSITC